MNHRGSERDETPENDVNAKLLEYAESREPGLRDELVDAHLGLVRQLARRFEHRGEPLDDLVQAGSLGLIKAIDRFDPFLGYEFRAYATKTILGELKRHFRDSGWSVRVPRRVQERYLEIGPIVEELTQRCGRPPTVRELAAAIGTSPDEVIEAMEAGHAYRPSSLDSPSPEGDRARADLGTEDPAFDTAEELAVLVPKLAELPTRERRIVELRFSRDLTQSEIAAELGISQMHVSRLLARAIATLRASINQT